MKAAVAGDTSEAAQALSDSDLRDLGGAARKLAGHALFLGGGLGFITAILKWISFVAAVYLMILDRTNGKTNMLTALLVPYIFYTMPHVLLSLLRGEVGKWIAIIALDLHLFYPRRFPDWLELPGALIIFTAVAPTFLVQATGFGDFICLVMACDLLQEHIRASGGIRNAFKKGNGAANTIGILLLLIYPLWTFVLSFLQ